MLGLRPRYWEHLQISLATGDLKKTHKKDERSKTIAPRTRVRTRRPLGAARTVPPVPVIVVLTLSHDQNIESESVVVQERPKKLGWKKTSEGKTLSNQTFEKK